MTGLFFQAFGSLLLVVILIFAVLYLLKKFVFKDYGFSAGKKNNVGFRIIGQIMLQPKKYIYIIKFYDRLLVIGLTDNNMNLLSEITDKDSLSIIESSFAPENNTNKSFVEILKNNLGIRT